MFPTVTGAYQGTDSMLFSACGSSAGDTRGENMTVLQRRDARGFEAGSFRKFVVGAALAVVGVAAAFGISQVIDQEATAEVAATTPAERNAIELGRAQRAEAMEQIDRALIEKYRPAVTSSPAAVLHNQGLDVLEKYNTLGVQNKPALTAAEIEQARSQAMVEHYSNQWKTGTSESQTGPR